MIINVLVVSKYKWRTREAKHREIRDIMLKGGFDDVVLTTLIKDMGTPDVDAEGRITYEWYEEHISKEARAQGYNFVVFQFSPKDGKRWGIKPSLKGSNQRDGDFFGESWIQCNETSVRRFKDRSKMNEYVKDIPHEIGHELTRQGITKLEVHDYDYKDIRNNIRGFYIDIGKQSSQLLALQFQISELMRKLFSFKNVFVRPFKQWDDVSQEYGLIDWTTYPKTGRHIGTDFRTPLGTEILAPKDCTVTRTGYSSALGFWCEVKVDDWYMVCLHLLIQPHRRFYRGGEGFARVGDSGQIKGIHAHLEGWNAPMDRESLTKDNWNKLTFNIKTKIK